MPRHPSEALSRLIILTKTGRPQSAAAITEAAAADQPGITYDKCGIISPDLAVLPDDVFILDQP